MAAAAKKKLILVPSEQMDGNKKSDRNENKLVRMSKKSRDFLGFTDDQVELWTAGSTDERSQSAVLLDIFQAFSKDIKKVRQMVKSGELKPSDMNRVAFVTTKMYNRITGGDDEKNVWISRGIHDTVMGADPEFLLFDSEGRVINAASRLQKSGLIGSDGAMAEVRPGPSTDPDGLVRNIQNAFSDVELTRRIEDLDWMAACYHDDGNRDYPVGGHIHVGNPARIARMPMSRREVFFRVLNKIMDEKLSVPCIRLDGDLGHKRRANCKMGLGKPGWGYFGEWRTCNGRLEHRTLSGMWMVHPTLAKCVVGTAKAITDEVFARWASNGYDISYVMDEDDASLGNRVFKNDFSGWEDSELCRDLDACRSSSEMRSILDDSKAGEISKAFLSKWHTEMRRLSTYDRYGDHIDGLREILSQPVNEINKWDRRIKQNWLENKKFIINL